MIITKSKAQTPYIDYQTQFPNSDFTFGYWSNNNISHINNTFYVRGMINFSSDQYPFIFSRKDSYTSNLSVYYTGVQTWMETAIFHSSLKSGYAFMWTDGTIGCSSSGLKILRIDKLNLAAIDSTFFCDSAKPSDGVGFFINNKIYTTSAYSEYYLGGIDKKRNLIRRIDTNLVMLNEQVIGDTSVTFGSYFLRESCNDNGLLMNTVNETEHCAMLIKLDSMGVEQWRKNYYTPAQTAGAGSSSGGGFIGMQTYDNGYIVVHQASSAGTNYFYGQSIVAKIDKNGNMVKEVQYTTAGDTTLELNSNFTNYVQRTQFYNGLIKTNDGNFAGIIADREAYGMNNHENYIVILDTNLNIIHRSPKLGSLYYLDNPGLVQTADSTIYLCAGTRINPNQTGMNVRVYSYKIGGQVGVVEYKNERSFKIYPNPAIHELNIELDEEPQLISIHNSLGQLVYSQTHDGSIKINVSNWSKGVYFVELRNTKTGTKQSQKVIVE